MELETLSKRESKKDSRNSRRGEKRGTPKRTEVDEERRKSVGLDVIEKEKVKELVQKFEVKTKIPGSSTRDWKKDSRRRSCGDLDQVAKPLSVKIRQVFQEEEKLLQTQLSLQETPESEEKQPQPQSQREELKKKFPGKKKRPRSIHSALVVPVDKRDRKKNERRSRRDREETDRKKEKEEQLKEKEEREKEEKEKEEKEKEEKEKEEKEKEEKEKEQNGEGEKIFFEEEEEDEAKVRLFHSQNSSFSTGTAKFDKRKEKEKEKKKKDKKKMYKLPSLGGRFGHLREPAETVASPRIISLNLETSHKHPERRLSSNKPLTKPPNISASLTSPKSKTPPDQTIPSSKSDPFTDKKLELSTPKKVKSVKRQQSFRSTQQLVGANHHCTFRTRAESLEETNRFLTEEIFNLKMKYDQAFSQIQSSRTTQVNHYLLRPTITNESKTFVELNILLTDFIDDADLVHRIQMKRGPSEAGGKETRVSFGEVRVRADRSPPSQRSTDNSQSPTSQQTYSQNSSCSSSSPLTTLSSEGISPSLQKGRVISVSPPPTGNTTPEKSIKSAPIRSSRITTRSTSSSPSPSPPTSTTTTPPTTTTTTPPTTPPTTKTKTITQLDRNQSAMNGSVEKLIPFATTKKIISEGDLQVPSQEEQPLQQSPQQLERNFSNSPSPGGLEEKNPFVTLEDNSQYVGMLNEINPDEVVLTRELNRGGSARIFLGTYRAQEVCVKVVRSKMQTKKFLQDLEKEYGVLSRMRSRYNLIVHGYCTKPCFCMVTEFCERGSLLTVMMNPLCNDMFFNWQLALKLAGDLVKGVLFLHEWIPPIVHRDIKSPNIFLDAGWNLKIGDFGLSRYVTSESMRGTLKDVRGTLTHCAPEVYGGNFWSKASDMYSVSIVLWELLTRVLTGKHVQPYSEKKELKMDFQVLLNAVGGGRPSLPLFPDDAKGPIMFSELIKDGWAHAAEDRPTFKEAHQRVVMCHSNYAENPDSWDNLISNEKKK